METEISGSDVDERWLQGCIRSLSRDGGGMLRLEDIDTRSSTGEVPLVVRLWYDK